MVAGLDKLISKSTLFPPGRGEKEVKGIVVRTWAGFHLRFALLNGASLCLSAGIVLTLGSKGPRPTPSIVFSPV